MGNRDSFLQRVREAVQAGNRPGSSAALEPRGRTGYQGAGLDPLARFCEEFRAAGGQPWVVPDAAAAVSRILDLVQEKSARRVLLGGGTLLDTLDLRRPLKDRGVEVFVVDELPAGADREAFFAADLGISEADFLVAETGSIVQRTRPDQPRSLSLLPPIHVVVANRSHLLPDLFDLFTAVGADNGPTPALPSCISLITGPSKTGDIELRLVTGVHGPGEVHAVLLS